MQTSGFTRYELHKLYSRFKGLRKLAKHLRPGIKDDNHGVDFRVFRNGLHPHLTIPPAILEILFREYSNKDGHLSWDKYLRVMT